MLLDSACLLDFPKGTREGSCCFWVWGNLQLGVKLVLLSSRKDPL